MQLSKETSLFKKDSIKDDIETAGTTASAYITQVTSDGIFVHQTDSGKGGTQPTDSTAYGVHISDDVDIIQGGKVVASYGATAKIGDTETWGKYYIEVADDGMKVIWKSAQAGTEIPVALMDSGGIHFYTNQTATILMDGKGIQGRDCVSINSDVYTLGRGLRTSADYQTIVGKYNKYGSATTNQLFAVGYGTSEGNRNTAFYVTSDGDVHVDRNADVTGIIRADSFSSQLETATCSKYGSVWTSGDITLYKRGGVVQCLGAPTISAVSGRTQIGTIPEGFRPAATMYVTATDKTTQLAFYSAGTVYISGAATAGAKYFSTTWVCG